MLARCASGPFLRTVPESHQPPRTQRPSCGPLCPANDFSLFDTEHRPSRMLLTLRWLHRDCSEDKTVRLWDARDGSGIAVFTEHDAEVTHVAFAAGGDTLVSAAHGTVCYRRMQEIVGETLKTEQRLLSGPGLEEEWSFRRGKPEALQLAVVPVHERRTKPRKYDHYVQ
ncbi:hypothetical protein C8T65DRAFT_140721 [Cerioporus squamosus]|nr:hypothetical protein C8T65DRAFT_140721 [Cerioporus squamosus]